MATTTAGGGNVPLTPALTPTLVSSTEAARILGWSVGRVNTYRKRGLLPAPVQFLGANDTRPVWRREDIVEYSVGKTLGLSVINGQTVLLNNRTAATLRRTYGIADDERIGAALVAQGILSPEQGEWLDRTLGEKGGE